jgi:ubiquinone/menaquinone biosynthesis C-methylase UbiE
LVTIITAILYQHHENYLLADLVKMSTEAGKQWDKTADKYNKYITITDDYAQKIMEDYLDKAIAEYPHKPEKFDFLDVASGPGAATMKLIDRFGDKANYVATDIASVMLETLQTKAQKLGVSVTTKVQDGQDMNEIANNSADFLFCLFGVIFFPDRSKGFAEMFRVLRPGGSAFITSWLETDTINYGYALAQRFGNEEEAKEKFSKPMILADKEIFRKEMHEAGFVDIKIDTIGINTSIVREGMIDMMKLNPILSMFEPDQVAPKLNEFFDDKLGKDVNIIPLKFIAHVAIAKKPVS